MKAKKGIILMLGISVLLVFAVLGLIIMISRQPIQRDLVRFSHENYNGAFFAMYDVSAYNEDDFAAFRGIPTMKADYTIKGWRDLSKFMTGIFSSQNTVTNVYLGLDPAIMWDMSRKDSVKLKENLEKYLAPYVSARPDVSFEILLPYPSLQYWADMKEEQMEEDLKAYQWTVEALSVYSNIKIYFLGGEPWLIMNPGNYLDDIRTNAHVSQKILLHAFCDQNYQIVPENAPGMLDSLSGLVKQEKNSPAVYPDLSDWCIVFFGDSVLEYYSGSFSIPGVVSGLTGAETYNCGVGGIPATEDPNAKLSFNRMVTRFLEQDTAGLEDDSNYLRGLTEYMQTGHEGKKYCFVVEFGLNDYFGGHAVENPEDMYDIGTYAGALRTGIRALQNAYPESEILLLTPTYTALFSGGTEINSEKGGVLTDYVDAALRVAEEMNVRCLDNYADSGIDAETYGKYLADGCHPNETGSFLLGNGILEYIGGVMTDEE